MDSSGTSEDRERNAALNRIQDQQLCVRNEMKKFQWQDVCREFELLLRLVDELGVQLGHLPAPYIKFLDDLDTELRVASCDKKSFKAMSKPNAGAFQVLKTQVKTALDDNHNIIDECKEETAKNSKEKNFSDDSRGESKAEMETSEQKGKKEEKKRGGGNASRVSAPPERSLQSHSLATDSRAQQFLLPPESIEERCMKSRPAAFCQAQKPKPKSRALSYVPRRLEDLSASERAEWCVLSPAKAMRLNQR